MRLGRVLRTALEKYSDSSLSGAPGTANNCLAKVRSVSYTYLTQLPNWLRASKKSRRKKPNIMRD